MVKHFIFFGIWAVIFGVEFLYRDPLRNKSLELQKQLAPHATEAGNVIFKYFHSTASVQPISLDSQSCSIGMEEAGPSIIAPSCLCAVML